MKRLLVLVALLSPLLSFADGFVPGIRVTIAPPAMRVEVRPVAPSPRHVWIPGYWAWRGGRHIWVAGVWSLPPNPGYVWEPARWVRENGAWMYYEGHWRSTEQPDPAYVYQPPAPPVEEEIADEAPPEPIVEVRPAPPFEHAVWVPGYWHWYGGRHVWVAGRWSAQPRGYLWEANHWDHRGDGKWVRHRGHWHPDDHEYHH